MSSPEQNYFSLFAMRYPVAWEFSVWADTSREIKIVFKVSIKFLVPRKKAYKKDGLRRRKLAQTTTQNQENKRKMLLIRKGVFVYKPCFFLLWLMKFKKKQQLPISNCMNHNKKIGMRFINWDTFVLKKLEHECARKISWEKANKATVASFQTIALRPVPEKVSLQRVHRFQVNRLFEWINKI